MIFYSMEHSKLPRRKMSKINTRTRTIGTNTDNNRRENHLSTGTCMKCHDYRNFQLYPYYFPFPIPICSCMANHFHNNFMDVTNICCKCENLKTVNMCNSHHCLKTCSSPSHSESSSFSNEVCNTCKNCSTTVANNDVKEQNERKLVSASLRSSRHAIKEDPIDYESDEDVPNEQNLTKYANDYLESSYRYKYESKPKTENTNLKEDSKNISKPHSSKHLLNHLLKPNTTKNLDKTEIEEDEEEDSDDLIELEEKDETETIFEDDDLSVKTVIRSSEDGTEKLLINIDKEKTVEIEERRPTRVNITHQNSSNRPQSQPAGNKKPRASEEEMLMMLKALVTTTQFNNNSERLNTILSHIETGASKKHENKKSNNGSRCSSPKSTSPRKRTNKVYGSVIPKLCDNKK